MKNKILSTIAILIFLISAAGITFPTSAEVTGFYLKMRVYPDESVLRVATTPEAGPDKDYLYAPGAVVTITASSPVNHTAPLAVKRYVFLNWTILFDNGTLTSESTTALSTSITLTENKTAIAYYKVQWLVTWDAFPIAARPAGWPGYAWVDDGATHTFSAPLEIPPKWVFLQWNISGTLEPYFALDVPKTVIESTNGTAIYTDLTAVYMSPSIVNMTAPAKPKEFNIDVVALNFRGLDNLYALDMNITFDHELIHVKSLTLYFDAIWGAGNYFNITAIDNTAGFVWVMASALGSVTFSGVKTTVLRLTFQVCYDPCALESLLETPIKFHGLVLANSTSHVITPGNLLNSTYQISAPTPKLEVRPTAGITVTHGMPQISYEVWLINGIKVFNYSIEVTYNTTQPGNMTRLQATSVSISDFLPGPYTKYSWSLEPNKVNVTVAQLQGNYTTMAARLFTITFNVTANVTRQWGILYDVINFTEASYISVFSFTTPAIQNIEAAELIGVPAPYKYAAKLGDVNLDFQITVLDLRAVALKYGLPVVPPYYPYDLDTDNDVDLFDIIIVAQNIDK